MSVPKSVIKIKKDNTEYTSSVDRVQYTIVELSRTALRDVGKFIRNKFKNGYYGMFRGKKGNVGRYTQYWVRREERNLQVGIKPSASYGRFRGLGSSKSEKHGLLQRMVSESIPEIIIVKSRYLSALEDEASTLSMIEEERYEGGVDS